MYVGVTFMAALNIIAEAVVLIAESIAIRSVEGTGMTRTLYIILAILSAILAVIQVLFSGTLDIDYLCESSFLFQTKIVMFIVLTLFLCLG